MCLVNVASRLRKLSRDELNADFKTLFKFVLVALDARGVLSPGELIYFDSHIIYILPCVSLKFLYTNLQLPPM